MKILVGSSAAKVHLPFFREAKEVEYMFSVLGVNV